MALTGGEGKWMPGLLAGATVAGLLGMGAVLLIRNLSRVKEDAALGIVLSVFFGLGAAVLGLVQSMQSGSAAGLESFIYGRTASMLASDAWRIGLAGAAVATATLLLFKEMAMLCFDQDFAASQGWPVHTLDVAMMALVVVVTVIGLQAVGLMLMVAMLVIPSAAARFWTDRLPALVAIAAAIGAVSGLIGAGISALVPRLPAGAIIILVAAVGFLVSLVAGPARGLLARGLRRWRLVRKVNHQNLMRALYERQERTDRRERTGGLGGPEKHMRASRQLRV
jgi:manganese/zinc/iron transport system permease protein